MPGPWEGVARSEDIGEDVGGNRQVQGHQVALGWSLLDTEQHNGPWHSAGKREEGAAP